MRAMTPLEKRLTRLELACPKPSLPIILDLYGMDTAQAARITEAPDLTTLPTANLLAILQAPRISAHD